MFKDFPKKKYDVIYADPPWNYAKSPMSPRKHVVIEQQGHYKTVKDASLKRLPVCDIAKENCILFVWVVSPKLQECMEIIDSWGCFDYITVGFVWEKELSTFGNYTLPSCEMCLIYKKGKIPLGGIEKHERQFVYERRTKHSSKPKQIRKRIENMFPGGDKIELFARPEKSTSLFTEHDWWDYWGEDA